MQEIDKIFNARAGSVQQVFHTEAGVAGFRIPEYQRQYAWDQANISRLFQDTKEGLISLERDENYLTFIGTVILVDESSAKERSFVGKSLSVVDGQQRLTTLATTAAILYQRIATFFSSIDTWPDDAITEVAKIEGNSVSDTLFSSSLGRPNTPRLQSEYSYFPRVVRQDMDQRGSTVSDSNYRSPIAEYLMQFSSTAIRGSITDFEFQPSGSSEVTKPFIDRLQFIRNEIDTALTSGNGTSDPIPPVNKLFSTDAYRHALFPQLHEHPEIIGSLLSTIEKKPDHPAYPMLTLVGLANYILNRVAITYVIAHDERYAFDMFEALNTTGEPLTALETFKPQVIRAENEDGDGFENSPSKALMESIERRINELSSYDAQQREVKELIALFALYTNGEKIAYHLNAQRNYLRRVYRDARRLDNKQKLINALSDVAEYRARFWVKNELHHQLRDEPGLRDQALFCLRFIRDLNNSLTIPILTRYWKYANDTGKTDVFITAVKAITAFLALRRAVTGGTQGIDEDYRNLMKQGPRTGPQKPAKAFESNRFVSPPAPDELKHYLRTYLSQKRINVTSKEEWIKRVTQQPLGRTGPATLSKFLFLCAANNTVENAEKPFLLRKGRAKSDRNYMQLSAWESQDFESIEHIAPQNPNKGWCDSLYENLDVIDLLGNLTLLPEKENSSIGNKPWKTKRLFYEGAGLATSEEVEQKIEEARNKGISFGERTKNMLRNGQALPLIYSIGNVDEWNASIVRERTENIAQLAWYELGPWLGFET